MAKENHELGGQGLKLQSCPSPGGAAVGAAVCSGGGLSQLRSCVAVAEPRVWRGLCTCGLPLGPPALPRLWPQLPCSSAATSGKKQAAKSKEELAQEKKKELERRLQDVSGQLGNSKKPAKRGTRGPRAAPPGAEGSGRERAAGGGLRLWLHLVTSCVSLEEAVDPPKP